MANDLRRHHGGSPLDAENARTWLSCGEDGAREVFARFQVEEVDTTYTISTAASGGGKRVKELIVSGDG